MQEGSYSSKINAFSKKIKLEVFPDLHNVASSSNLYSSQSPLLHSASEYLQGNCNQTLFYPPNRNVYRDEENISNNYIRASTIKLLDTYQRCGIKRKCEELEIPMQLTDVQTVPSEDEKPLIATTTTNTTNTSKNTSSSNSAKMRLSLCSCIPTMFSINNLSFRPLSVQSPRRVFNIDNKWNGSGRLGRLKLTLRRRQICKNCTSQKIVNEKLLREIHWLKTGVQNMLRDKEIEVFERVSMTMDDLYNENQRLKEKVFIEERIRVWGTSYTPFDKVDFIRERYHRSLDEITDLERKINQMENEAWNLKSIIHKKNLELKWFEEDMEKKENDALKMKQRISEVEFDNCGYRIALDKMTEDCMVNSRNQRLQSELNELSINELQDLEEYKDWKFLKEMKDNLTQLKNDNDRLKQDIAKEKDTAVLRFSTAENEVRQSKLDFKTKCEENQSLQTEITQRKEHAEELQESLSNIKKEKQRLLESNNQFEKVNSYQNDQIQLATDKSTRLQEKLKELQSENSNLRHDIEDVSKQKEDALNRIRSLENVNSNYNDQLILATDNSKRLQGRIKELQVENSRLQRDIDDLSKQKEDALTRLSKVAGAKLTHGNAAITDLSDTDRPTKLAETFSELYDNAWTDAFEELDNTFHNEEETIKVLLQIFQETYKFCVKIENNYETRIGQAVFTIANETESHQITNTNVEIQKVLVDLRISLSTACCSVIEHMLLSKLPSILKSVDVTACPMTKLFACQCASLSWKMRIRDPPLFVRFEFRCGTTFNSDVLKRYTKTGGYLDFLVWPALYLHENGPVLAKGVAQPKIAP